MMLENYKHIIGLIILVILIWMFGFSRYIFDDYIFFGVSDDMRVQILPYLIEMHYQIYNGESMLWSFFQGLGAGIWVGNPNYHGDIFAWILALLPVAYIPKGIIYVHLLKIISATILFYIYLSQFKILQTNTKLIGALFYTFSGTMLCRGPWFHYATEVVMIVPVLIGLEKWYRNNESWFITVSLAFLIVSRYPTYIYVYTLYVFGYILLRYWFDYNFSFSKKFVFLIKFIPKYFYAICLSAIFVLPGILMFLGSSRIGINSKFGLVCSTFPIDVILSNIVKFYMPNITALSGHILEDLAGYSGVLVLLLCLLAIFSNSITKKRKKYFLVILSIISCMSIFCAPMVLMNFFTLYSAKMATIWVHVALILMAVYSLEKLDFCYGYCVVGCAIILFLAVVFKCHDIGISILRSEVILAVILLVVYGVILKLLPKNREKLSQVLLGVVFVECCFSCTLANMPYNLFYSNKENIDNWNNYHSDYFDLKNIGRTDMVSRIAVVNSGFDDTEVASIGRFYGFDRYNSLYNKEFISFLNYYNASWLIAPTHDYWNLGAFKGLRSMCSAQLVYDRKNGSVYFNDDSVSFGYLYNYCIKYEDANKLPFAVRDDYFSKACIVEKNVNHVNNIESVLGYLKANQYNVEDIIFTHDIEVLSNHDGIKYKVIGDYPFVIYRIDISDFNFDYSMMLRGSVEVSDSNNNLLGLNIPYKIFYAEDTANLNENNSCVGGTRNNNLVCVGQDWFRPDIKYMRLDIGKKGQIVHIKDLEFSSYEVTSKDPLNHPYTPYVPFDKNSVCETVSFSPTEIHLKANTNDPRILFLSIPYDRGWSIYDNGKEVEVMHVNIGFMGAYLEPGEHNIVVKYRTPGLYEGAAISGITAIALLIMWIRRRRSGVA